MSGRVLKVLLPAVGVVASCLLFLPPMLGMGGAEQTETTRGILLLAEPVFAQQEMTFIQEEAGISAWTKLEGGIDLDRAATAFRIVERQTDEYVIGSVELPGFPEAHDARVFVHRDGWVLAYYFKATPVAKIIDWKNPAVTKLEQALGLVTTAAGVPVGEVEHYDFRFPDAEKIMVIVDDDTFRLKIPDTFTIFERSYSFWAISEVFPEAWAARGGGGWLTIDERDILLSRNREVKIGTLTAVQLRLGVFQTVGVRYGDDHHRECGIAIVLVYRER